MRHAGRIKFAVLGLALAGLLLLAPTAGAVTSNGKTVPLSVSCGASPYGGPYGNAHCSGSISLTGNKAKKKKKRHAVSAKVVNFGSANFDVPAGTSQQVNVKLTGAGRKALKSAGKIKVNVVVTTGSTVSSPQKLTVKLKKKKKHKK
jgi:hypothetical protein